MLIKNWTVYQTTDVLYVHLPDIRPTTNVLHCQRKKQPHKETQPNQRNLADVHDTRQFARQRLILIPSITKVYRLADLVS